MILPGEKISIHGVAETEQKPLETVLASSAPMGSEKWELCLVTPETNQQLESLFNFDENELFEANPFFKARFLSAAFRRVAAHDTSFVILYRSLDETRHVRMVFPIEQVRAGKFGPQVIRSWSHDYAPLGVPLLRKDDYEETICRFVELLGNMPAGRAKALMFDDVPLENPFAIALRKELQNQNLFACELSYPDRAALNSQPNKRQQFELQINSKKKRQLNRQLKRLGELGELKAERAESFTEVVVRFEEFLLLEANGWKGRKGTSLRTVKQTAAFARQAVSEMSKSGHASIYSLRLDGRSIASLVMMRERGVFYPWKIAFDADFAKYSPGALLMFRVSQELGSKACFERSDSLAGSENPLVNLLWKDRLEIGALVIGLGPNGKRHALSAMNSVNRFLNVKRLVKSLLKRR